MNTMTILFGIFTCLAVLFCIVNFIYDFSTQKDIEELRKRVSLLEKINEFNLRLYQCNKMLEEIAEEQNKNIAAFEEVKKMWDDKFKNNNNVNN